jgi:hypothetical protein
MFAVGFRNGVVRTFNTNPARTPSLHPSRGLSQGNVSPVILSPVAQELRGTVVGV